MNKILVLAPYSQNLLMALNDARIGKLADFVLVGNKNLIIEKSYQLGIAHQNFEIVDAENEIDILLKLEDLRKELIIDLIVFGDISDQHKLKILNCNEVEDLGDFTVLDLDVLKHYVFVSNYRIGYNVDFEDKKNSIVMAKEFMNALDINRVNVCFIGNKDHRLDVLEKNIVKMCINDTKLTNINFIDLCTIGKLFNKNEKYNIYQSNINLLMFKNYDTSQIFIDTLNEFVGTKIARFIFYNNQFAIDADKIINYGNVLFSIFMYIKMRKKRSLNLQKEHIMV